MTRGSIVGLDCSFSSVDLFGDVRPTGEVISTLEKYGVQNARKPLIKMLGNDRTFMLKSRDLISLGLLYEHPKSLVSSVNWKALRAMTSTDAFRVLGLFPSLLAPKEVEAYGKKEKDDIREIRAFHTEASLWLLDSRSFDSRYKGDLYRMGLGAYEKYADLCAARYRMISKMKANESCHRYFWNCSVPLTWLLVEASACRRKLRDMFEYQNKTERYKDMSAFWKRAANSSDETDTKKHLPVNYTQSAIQNLENFEGFFLKEARELAFRDISFQKGFYDPCIRLQQSWQNAARKKKGAVAFM